MKKIFFNIATILVAAAVVFTACKKPVINNGDDDDNNGNTSQYAQVRFKKTVETMYVTEMALYTDFAHIGVPESKLAYYSFGVQTGTSPYYNIPAGNYYPAYYSSFDESYYTCGLSHTFHIGDKITIVCGDENGNLSFYVE